MAEPTQFDIASAQRISNVVQAVEGAPPPANPLEFRRALDGRVKAVRICTFTGAWSIGSAKSVTFKYVTTTPNTVTASNLFFPITETAAAADCAIARDGTAWFLIDVPFATATVSFVSGITVSASLNTSSCSITVGQTLATSTASYLRLKVT